MLETVQRTSLAQIPPPWTRRLLCSLRRPSAFSSPRPAPEPPPPLTFPTRRSRAGKRKGTVFRGPLRGEETSSAPRRSPASSRSPERSPRRLAGGRCRGSKPNHDACDPLWRHGPCMRPGLAAPCPALHTPRRRCSRWPCSFAGVTPEPHSNQPTPTAGESVFDATLDASSLPELALVDRTARWADLG
jgi:hypothetical protein